MIEINNVELLSNAEIKDKKGVITISTFISLYIPEFVHILWSYHLLILSSYQVLTKTSTHIFIPVLSFILTDLIIMFFIFLATRTRWPKDINEALLS